MSSDPLPAWNEDPARYLRGGEGSNQPDRSSCFRSSPSSLPALPLAFLFFPENATGATTIDTWRGAEGRGDEGRGGGREGRVAPHISLISVSVVVVVSVGGRSQQRVGEGPTIHPSIISSPPRFVRVQPSPPLSSFIYTPTLLLFPSSFLRGRNSEVAKSRQNRREARRAPPIHS